MLWISANNHMISIWKIWSTGKSRITKQSLPLWTHSLNINTLASLNSKWLLIASQFFIKTFAETIKKTPTIYKKYKLILCFSKKLSNWKPNLRNYRSKVAFQGRKKLKVKFKSFRNKRKTLLMLLLLCLRLC